MSPRVVGHGRRQKARGWRLADQARPLAACLGLLALAGCGDRFAEIDPRPAFANLFGAHLEGREPPPGLDQPWPNLASVPPRPTPPDPAYRARLSAGLVEDRQSSRTPTLPSGARPAGPAAAGPPTPPRLAAVPAVRFDESLPAPLTRPAPAAMPVPVPAQPAPLPSQPAAAPSRPEPAPPPGLVAPPPPPGADLLAPAPPGADLLAPPPPPSRDLLAPRRD